MKILETHIYYLTILSLLCNILFILLILQYGDAVYLNMFKQCFLLESFTVLCIQSDVKHDVVRERMSSCER